jgi:hypothetical protein
VSDELFDPWLGEDYDLSDCPYYARWTQAPGHDPDAVCSHGCYELPACITDRPREGWPSERAS